MQQKFAMYDGGGSAQSVPCNNYAQIVLSSPVSSSLSSLRRRK